MTDPIQRRRFDNGIVLVTETLPHLRSVSLGVWINTGSRDELPHEHGISHYLEHTFFKGTASRSAERIAQEMDAMGGELNAFTTREQTTFYVKVLSDRLDDATDLLLDVLTAASFEPEQLAREAQVIVEEIRMVEDEPEEWVHDLHGEHMWGATTPLGRPILGTEETVRGFGPAHIRDYLTRCYTADRIVVAAAGNLDPDRLYARLAPYMAQFPAHGPAAPDLPPADAAPADRDRPALYHRKLEQVHLVVGGHGLSQGHPDRFGMYVLNDLLGGGSSSRLFQEIREKRGLAYSVYSSHASYRDCGELTVYAGAGPDSIDEVAALIVTEIDRLCTEPVDAEELERIKGHLKGSLILSLEGTFNRMSRLAQDEFVWGATQPIDALVAGIDRVDAAQVMRLARFAFDPAGRCATLLGDLTAPPSALLGQPIRP
ncbi:MAG: insulinase family protein [Nitrospirae bacterium]|nr:insulinase family protein [Nitrospirota bacterium]